MSDIVLRDPKAFSEKLLKHFLEEGWQSLSKRDMELLIYILLEQDGFIDRFASNHVVAKQLRLTPSKISSLRRDAYARWRPLVAGTTQQVIRRILKHTLTKPKLTSAARYASEKSAKDGFLALLVEHPDDRAELEEALKNLDAIPVYERNPQVILVHYETLFQLAKEYELLDDFEDIQKALKKLCGNRAKDLEDFLKKDIKKLEWEDVRAALNATAAKIAAGQLVTLAAGELSKVDFAALAQAIFSFLR